MNLLFDSQNFSSSGFQSEIQVASRFLIRRVPFCSKVQTVHWQAIVSGGCGRSRNKSCNDTRGAPRGLLGDLGAGQPISSRQSSHAGRSLHSCASSTAKKTAGGPHVCEGQSAALLDAGPIVGPGMDRREPIRISLQASHVPTPPRGVYLLRASHAVSAVVPAREYSRCSLPNRCPCHSRCIRRSRVFAKRYCFLSRGARSRASQVVDACTA
jgi:hypothetical protein